MPWLLFPYNSLNISKLESEFDVCNIPRLIVQSSDGKVISMKGAPEGTSFVLDCGEVTTESRALGTNGNETHGN